MKNEDAIADHIRRLQGLIRLERLDEEQIAYVKAECPIKENNGYVEIVHSGLKDVLERDEVYIILKKSNFRPPPTKTVYMVEDSEDTTPPLEHQLSVRDQKYYIIGEEIFLGEEEPKEPYYFLSDGFVLYTNRRKERKHVPAYFLIPPIGFPELESMQNEFCIRNVVSVSPSTSSDRLLRSMFDLEDKPDFATILVGFDRIQAKP